MKGGLFLGLFCRRNDFDCVNNALQILSLPWTLLFVELECDAPHNYSTMNRDDLPFSIHSVFGRSLELLCLFLLFFRPYVTLVKDNKGMEDHGSHSKFRTLRWDVRDVRRTNVPESELNFVSKVQQEHGFKPCNLFLQICTLFFFQIYYYFVSHRISFKPPYGFHLGSLARCRMDHSTNIGKHGRNTVGMEATSMNFTKMCHKNRDAINAIRHKMSTSIFCRISVSNVPGGSGGPGWEGGCLVWNNSEWKMPPLKKATETTS